MNSLLIYNENLSPDFINSFQTEIGDIIPFSINNQTLSRDDYSFDGFIHNFLICSVQKSYDVIFLPINLSIENYLEFSGLRIGYHIRLSNNFINQDIPIVFLAREDSYEINKLSIYGDILSCPHIFLTDKLEVKSIKKQVEFIKKLPRKNVVRDFLNRVNLKPTGNYTTHHSISNEWSIIRWSKALINGGILREFPKEIGMIEKIIESNLYYKYLGCRYPIESSQHIGKSDLKLKYNGKVLYIDDEHFKGWSTLFQLIFKSGGINEIDHFEVLNIDFDNIEKKELIKKCVEKSTFFDVLILDFRLTQDDFSETDVKQISGFQILEKLKEINRGIQVIIFTASNKVWNVKALQEAGADGFIVKESPENTLDNQFTRESLLNLKITVNQCLRRSRYLISWFKINKELKEFFEHNQECEYNAESKQMVNVFSEFQLDVINQLEVAYYLIDRTYVSESQYNSNQSLINHAYTSLYKILEYHFEYNIKDQFTIKHFDEVKKRFVAFDKTKHSKIQSGIITYISEYLKYDAYGYNKILNNFRILRNGVTHPGEKKPSEIDCLELLRLIRKLIIRKY